MILRAIEIGIGCCLGLMLAAAQLPVIQPTPVEREQLRRLTAEIEARQAQRELLKQRLCSRAGLSEQDCTMYAWDVGQDSVQLRRVEVLDAKRAPVK